MKRSAVPPARELTEATQLVEGDEDASLMTVHTDILFYKRGGGGVWEVGAVREPPPTQTLQ